ncbi:MAG: lipocalin family protein [Candidatus Neomarinimicrobiota bacterium]
MRTGLLLITVSIPLLIISCALLEKNSPRQIPLVQHVDLNKYAGRWYEIARFPHRFERDLVNVTATYTLLEDGRIEVRNQGFRHSLQGKPSDIKGIAWVPDLAVPARLKVRFFWPFAADYRIIALDAVEYQYAIVTSSSWKYLWILGRQPQMEPELYDRLVTMAQQHGFDVSRLYRVPQDW